MDNKILDKTISRYIVSEGVVRKYMSSKKIYRYIILNYTYKTNNKSTCSYKRKLFLILRVSKIGNVWYREFVLFVDSLYLLHVKRIVF